MRIDIFENLLVPTGESAGTKTGGGAEGDTVFFALMNQLQTLLQVPPHVVGPQAATPEPNSSGKDGIENDALGQLLAASLASATVSPSSSQDEVMVYRMPESDAVLVECDAADISWFSAAAVTETIVPRNAEASKESKLSRIPSQLPLQIVNEEGAIEAWNAAASPITWALTSEQSKTVVLSHDGAAAGLQNQHVTEGRSPHLENQPRISESVPERTDTQAAPERWTVPTPPAMDWIPDGASTSAQPTAKVDPWPSFSVLQTGAAAHAGNDLNQSFPATEAASPHFENQTISSVNIQEGDGLQATQRGLAAMPILSPVEFAEDGKVAQTRPAGKIGPEVILRVPEDDEISRRPRELEGMTRLDQTASLKALERENPEAARRQRSSDRFDALFGATNNHVSAHDPKVVSATRPSGQSPAQVRDPEFIIQLADRIRVQVGGAEEEIRIQLKPEHLGRLEIRAERGLSGVVAKIVTESGSVKNYLENNLHILQQNLRDQGLRVDRIEITVLDSFRQPTMQQQFGEAGTGEQQRETAQHRSPGSDRTSATLEEIVLDPATFVVLHPNSTFHTVA